MRQREDWRARWAGVRSLGLAVWVVTVWVGLTAFAWGQGPAITTGARGDALVAELGCALCHTDLPGSALIRQQAPDLGHAGLRFRPGYVLEYLQNPRPVRRHIGRARMPNFHLTEAEALALTLYLDTLREMPTGWPELPPGLRGLDKASPVLVSRADFERELSKGLICLTCHPWHGRGGFLGPELADLGAHLRLPWMAAYLVSPEQFGVPPAVMPPQFYQVSADRRHFEAFLPDADRRILTLVGHLSGIGAGRAAELDAGFARVKEAHPGVTAAQGRLLFEALNCAACHRHPTLGPRTNAAPALASAGSRLQPDWLVSYLRKPAAIRRAGFHPGDASRMPDFGLRDDEVRALATFLSAQQKPLPASSVAISNAPLSAFSRAKARTLLETKLACLGCHRLDGKGGVLGPDLSQVKARLQPAYVHGIIADPQLVIPHTTMPKLPLPPEIVSLVARYLLQSEGTAPESGGYLSPLEYSLPLTTDRTPAGDGTPSAPPLVRSIFLRHCAGCHGVEGRGNGFNAPFLAPVRPAAFTDAESLSKRPDDTLFDGIFSGGAILNRSHWMPAWGGTLGTNEIRGLVRHLRQLCRCDAPAWSRDGSPENAGRPGGKP